MMDIEIRLDNAVASLSMEGMTVTEEEKDLARKCARHEITYDEAVLLIIDKYIDHSQK